MASASGSAPPESEGTGAARHHLDPALVAVGEHAGDLLRGLRQHDDEG